ncbi:MAG: ABC transporter permease [Chloroflexota bacterium]|nr:ABC transporter permease [Chloroflexia bacterium]MDQ3443777.1 ABC transporter permease [Chloroflexota bacterium]
MAHSTTSAQTASPPLRRPTATLAEEWRPRRFASLRGVVRDRSALAGLAILVTVTLLALFASVIAPYDPTKLDPTANLAGPSADHWLGTDNLGRDLFSRLLYGARWTLGAAGLAAAGIVLLGVTVGIVAGYFGGLVDDLLMRLVDVLLAFPSIVLALAIVGMLGPSLPNVLIGMVAVWWVDYARVVRGLTLKVVQNDYVLSAHCCGCGSLRMITRHVLPNVIPPVIVLATLELGALMLAISGLSFLGLGAQPPTPEWGTMLSDGRLFFLGAPQLMMYPGIAITLVVLGCNLLGDGLRDALDPRQRRR